MTKGIGIALSGGGHRATAYCLGSLLYLVDSRQNKHVQTIASVSGGSLTNAYTALLDEPFNMLEKPDFRKHSASFARQIAGSPILWWTAIILTLISFVVWLLPIALWTRLFVWFFFVALSILIGPRSKGTLWGWWGTWLYLNLLILTVSIFASGVLSLIPQSLWGFQIWDFSRLWDFPLPQLSIVLLVPIFFLAFSRRHVIAGLAFGSTLRGPSKTSKIHLDACTPGNVQHIYCATVLTPGRHFYFSRDFVFSPSYGVGSPAAVKLCDAVQASSNFPPAFPYRSFQASDFQFAKSLRTELPKSFLLTDGGVYDNTSTAWFLELDEYRLEINRQVRYNRFAEAAKEQLTAVRQEIAGLQEKIRIIDREIAALRVQIESDEDSRIRSLKKLSINDAMQTRELLKLQIKTKQDASISKFEKLISDSKAIKAPVSLANLLKLAERIKLPDQLLAVNAAYPKPWRQGKSFGVLNIVKVLYNTSNFRRFKDLRRHFLTGKLAGAFVSIEEGPLVLATCLANPKKWLPAYDPERDDILIWSANTDPVLLEARARLQDKLDFMSIKYVTEEDLSMDLTERAEQALEHMAPGVKIYVQMSRAYSERIHQKLTEAKQIKKALDHIEADQVMDDQSIALKDEYKQKLDALIDEIRELEKERNKQDFTATKKLKAFRELFESIRNTDVPTTFRPLGKKRTAELMRHGYLCAMILLHILTENHPLIDAPTPEQFEELASGKAA